MSAINMINNSIPTERSRHIDIQMFAIQDWVEQQHLIMHHIPGVINPADALTKPLGWVLHHRHVRRIMGHYPPSYSPTSTLLGANQGKVLSSTDVRHGTDGLT